MAVKYICVYLLLVIFITSCNDNSQRNQYLYVVSRNTGTKEGRLVLEYNQFTVPISHIGIAFSRRRDALIYHVLFDDADSAGTHLKATSFEQFWNSPIQSDNRLWQIPVTSAEFKKSVAYVDSISKQKIYYDFDTLTHNGMYCSEFVYNIIKAADKSRFTVARHCVELEGMPKLLLGKGCFCYYPADFFLQYNPIHSSVATD